MTDAQPAPSDTPPSATRNVAASESAGAWPAAAGSCPTCHPFPGARRRPASRARRRPLRRALRRAPRPPRRRRRSAPETRSDLKSTSLARRRRQKLSGGASVQSSQSNENQYYIPPLLCCLEIKVSSQVRPRGVPEEAQRLLAAQRAPVALGRRRRRRVVPHMVARAPVVAVTTVRPITVSLIALAAPGPSLTTVEGVALVV